MLGLRPVDFEGMDKDEFEAACASFADHEEQAERSRWERARTLGLMSLQPWSRTRLTPEKVLPFPWDMKAPEPERVTMTKAERRKRMEAMKKKLGGRY